MKIAHCSDLHLDIGPQALFCGNFPDADVLILAGDIAELHFLAPRNEQTYMGANVRSFLIDACAKYKNVIWVPGNHEYYGGIIQDSEKNVGAFKKELGLYNLFFLEKNKITIDTVDFVCATLWTDINKANPVCIGLSSQMNDYAQIQIRNFDVLSQLWPADTLSIHQSHRRFISLNSDKKSVVVTHHAPSLLSSEYKQGLTAFYCCTDMDDIILDNCPQLWIHGHTHEPVDYYIDKTRIVSNPRGYVGSNIEKYFNIKVIEI